VNYIFKVKLDFKFLNIPPYQLIFVVNGVGILC